MRDFKTGEFITLAEGDYSSYVVNGLFKVIEDFNIDELHERFLVEVAPQTAEDIEWGRGLGHIEKFQFWLLTNKFLTEVDYREIHLGDAWDLDISTYKGGGVDIQHIDRTKDAKL